MRDSLRLKRSLLSRVANSHYDLSANTSPAIFDQSEIAKDDSTRFPALIVCGAAAFICFDIYDCSIELSASVVRDGQNNYLGYVLFDTQ